MLEIFLDTLKETGVVGKTEDSNTTSNTTKRQFDVALEDDVLSNKIIEILTQKPEISQKDLAANMNNEERRYVREGFENDKQETKASIDNLIRDTLWKKLPESYDDKSIADDREKIYEYVYTHYPIVA